MPGISISDFWHFQGILNVYESTTTSSLTFFSLNLPQVLEQAELNTCAMHLYDLQMLSGQHQTQQLSPDALISVYCGLYHLVWSVGPFHAA